MSFQPGDRVVRTNYGRSMDNYCRLLMGRSLTVRGTVSKKDDSVPFFPVFVIWDDGNVSNLPAYELRRLSPLEQLAEAGADE